MAPETTTTPLVTLCARPVGPKCPFGEPVEFSLRAGGCVSLVGSSGMGKTTISNVLAGLVSPRAHVLSKLDMEVTTCEWDPSIPTQERCGVLFQQTTLLDELTVAGNLCVALSRHNETFASKKQRDLKIKQLLDTVGLDYARDAAKQPTELSGGMGRRASLALQLAQQKHVIILDEPFTGLDHDAAVSVAKELVHLRNTQKTALILISHEPELSKVVMDPDRTHDNHIVELQPPTPSALKLEQSQRDHSIHHGKPSLFGTTFVDRFVEKLADYILYSLPLIAMAFGACGLAISMLSADLLQRLDVSDRVLAIVDKEVRPLIKMLTGEDATMLQMLGIKFKVQGMLNSTMPQAKATLYAVGLCKLFVLEVGPLLTALLLCGRIGGSYAGKVGTMQATAQNKLLQTLGINPQMWSLWPSLFAALIAAPVLTVLGTGIALFLGSVVGPHYGIGDHANYSQELRKTLWPVFRLRCLAPLWDKEDNISWSTTAISDVLSSAADVRTTFSDSYLDALIEIVTYPPIYHLLKAIVFILIIMLVAEVCAARLQPNLTPRGVPAVITSAVVSAGLLVILADWAFSQLWLLRE